MPPPMQRFGGGPNSIAGHYAQYPPHSQAHSGGLPPPSMANPSFMNPNSMGNPFAVNGNALSLAGGFGGGGGLGAGGGTGLASHAAQMGFAHGASLQQQAHNGVNEGGQRGAAAKGRIRDVWKSNLHEEMEHLRRLVDKYPYIAMDTEFPGLVARPMGLFRGKSDYHYQTLRCNVDLLKIIQIGITLFSEDGETPPARPQAADSGIDMNLPSNRKYNNNLTPFPCTWQFNFKFSLEEDMYSESSINSLRSAGLDFAGIEQNGIDPFEFAALLISSGLVCDEDVRWISFHGGYDFGYLTKCLICKPLPDDEADFTVLMKKFFPSIYDVKYLMNHAAKTHPLGTLNSLEPNVGEMLAKYQEKKSLETMLEIFKVKRQGSAHQGGSDALVTGKVFFAMRDRIFNGEISDTHLGQVWGLGYPEHNNTPHPHSTPQNYTRQLQENTTPSQNGYSNGSPSTPQTGHAGLAGTPVHVNNGAGLAPMTPGGGGGAFGNFKFGQ